MCRGLSSTQTDEPGPSSGVRVTMTPLRLVRQFQPAYVLLGVWLFFWVAPTTGTQSAAPARAAPPVPVQVYSAGARSYYYSYPAATWGAAAAPRANSTGLAGSPGTVPSAPAGVGLTDPSARQAIIDKLTE